jgi:ABC-type multidrug transport system ATPase subunit
MEKVTITLKNYRCFEDGSPAIFEIGDGLTAFIGPNNSGKSSILRFFYEMRNIWGNLPSWFPGLRTGGYQAQFHGVEDPIEPFCDANERPMTVDFQWAGLKGQTVVHQLELTIDRTGRVTGQMRGGPDDVDCPGWSSNGLALAANGSQFSVTHIAEMCANFAASLYIGPFRNAITEGQSNYYDLQIGTQFISTWHQWKAGPNKTYNRTIARIESEISQIFGYSSLEVSAASDMRSLHLNIDRKPYKLREVGAGLSEFLVVLTNAAISRPKLLLIDEPELHLHPSLQVSFLTALAAYAPEATLFATHSIGLARSTAERLYSTQRKNGVCYLREFGQITNYAEFAGELSFASFKEMGYDSILLVEGVTELKGFQHFLRLLNADKSVVVLPLGGDNIIKVNAEEELAELGRLSSHVSVIIDSERQTRGAALNTQRQKFLEACKKLRFDAMATERRAFENYLPARAVKAVKGERYNALGDFERLNQRNPTWKKADNWRIAREMTRDELAETDIGRFLGGVARKDR